MILYGVLVKTESLGSTDGFSVIVPTFLGYAPHQDGRSAGALLAGARGLRDRAPCWSTLYFHSVAGALAMPLRDNEIRVEFLGLSVPG